MSKLVIRSAQEKDAEQLVEFFAALDEEAEYMLFEPGERRVNAARQRELIHEMNETGLRTVLVAVAGDALIGFVGVTRMGFRRRSHVAQIIVGVLGDYHRRGIGNSLLARAEAWAREKGVRRLELTVAEPNAPAVALYKRRGYEVEGLRVAALQIGPDLVDEYHMALRMDSV